MLKKDLKARAKCLRTAISTMLNIEITNAQSLELVAKEENYPNWDAAVASFKHTSCLDEYDEPLHLDILLQKGRYENLDTLVKESWFSLQLRSMLDLNTQKGGLVLVTGVAGHGKTTTAKLIVEDLITRSERKIGVLHYGLHEFKYPEQTNVKFIEDNSGIVDAIFADEELVVIDDIRTPQDLLNTFLLAENDKKVIAILHAISPVKRISKMLGTRQPTVQMFNNLVSQRQIMTITQSFDPAHFN